MNIRGQASYQKPLLRRLGSRDEAVRAGLPTEAELAALVRAPFPEQFGQHSENGTAIAGADIILGIPVVEAAPARLAM